MYLKNMSNIESFIPKFFEALNSIAEPKITDWITVIVVSINLIISGIIIAQFVIAKRSFQAEHEKARREKAIEMLQFWHQRLSRRSTVARKLVESFTFDQAKKLLDQEMVSRIPLEHKSFVLAIFPDIELQGKEGLIEREQEFDLKPEYSGILRWEIVNYLNHLETILSAWHHNVADKNMIEEQLTYLVSLKDNHYLLESFRRAAGDAESYPCIKAFITHLTDKKAKPSTGKKKLG